MLLRLFIILLTVSQIFTMGKRIRLANGRVVATPRIKDVRRRPRAGTPTGGVPDSQPGPFASFSAAPSFPTSGFSAPSTQSNGFTFGQSQSFPGASSAPTQSNQSGSTSFSFGGGGPTGFNFSAGLGSSTNNPFASNSFSAGASASPQPTSNMGTTGFGGFGNQPVSQPPFSFGAQQAPATSTSNTPIFGQAANSSAANSVSDSMQTSPDAKPKGPSFSAGSSSVQKNLFGATGTTRTTNLFSPQPTAAPTNPFGGLTATSTSAQPSSDKANGPTATPAFAAQTDGPAAPTQPFGSLFGTTATTSAASEPEKATTPQPTANNIFAPKPASEASTDSATTSQPFKALFGAPAASPPAFGRLSPNPTSEQAPVSNLFAPKPAAEQQGTNQTANVQPALSLFGNPATTPSVSAPDKTQTPAPAAIPSLFSPKPAAGEQPAETQPFKIFSGTTAAPSQAAESAKPQATPRLFAPKPAAAQSPEKAAAANPLGSLFGAPTATSGPSEPAKSQPPSAAPPNMFGAKPSAEQAPMSLMNPPASPVGNLFGAKTTAPEPKAPQAPLGAPTTTPAAKSPLDKIPQLGKPALSGSKVNDDAELLWKVRSLDHFFQQEIATCQPGTDSFDNLILFYMKARHAMGAPVKPKGAIKLKNGMLTHMTPPSRTDAPLAKPNPVPSSASATSNLFSQSFSSSPPQLADGPSAAKPPSAARSSSPPKPNPFASLSTGGATNATAVNANANVPSAPKVGGNMFANASAAGTKAPAASTAVPKFGNGASGTDFMAQFKKKAEQTMAKEKAKRKAEDFDSDEDDEVEWERRDAEKQREKRAKLEAASKQKTIFVPGEGFKFVDVDEIAPSDSSTSAVKPVDKSPVGTASPSPSASIFESSSRPVSNSENIFGRLSATPQPPGSGRDSGGSDDEDKPSSPKRRASEDDSGEEDEFAAAMRKSKRAKPSDNAETTKSSLDTPLPAPVASAGRSLFDRVESPAPQKETATSSLFSSSLSKATASPSDQTWKPNSPIKFSTNPAPATGLFGATVPSVPPSTQDSSADNLTSGAVTPDEEAAPGAIYDMSNANAGEEEEEVAFECRARAFKLATGWVSQGTGTARLLKLPGTGRSRIVLRADPGGNIILNTLLKKEFDYSRANNSVQFMVPQPGNEKPEHWAIRVKAESIDGLYNKIQEIKN